MHLGEMKFKKKSGKDDQAMPDGTDAAGNVAKLLGNVFILNIHRPSIIAFYIDRWFEYMKLIFWIVFSRH